MAQKYNIIPVSTLFNSNGEAGEAGEADENGEYNEEEIILSNMWNKVAGKLNTYLNEICLDSVKNGETFIPPQEIQDELNSFFATNEMGEEND